MIKFDLTTGMISLIQTNSGKIKAYFLSYRWKKIKNNIKINIEDFFILLFLGLILFCCLIVAGIPISLLYLYKKYIKKIELYDLAYIVIIVIAVIFFIIQIFNIVIRPLRNVFKNLGVYFNGDDIIVDGYVVEVNERNINKSAPSSNSIPILGIESIIYYNIFVEDASLGKKIKIIFDIRSYCKYIPQKGMKIRYKCLRGGFFTPDDIYFDSMIYQM